MVGNDGVKHIAELPKLVFLNLDATRIRRRRSRAARASCRISTTLSLNETGVTDAGLKQLGGVQIAAAVKPAAHAGQHARA